MLFYLVYDILCGRTHKADSREFLPHVFERVAAMVQSIVNYQPAVVRRFSPDERVYRLHTSRGIMRVTQGTEILFAIDSRRHAFGTHIQHLKSRSIYIPVDDDDTVLGSLDQFLQNHACSKELTAKEHLFYRCLVRTDKEFNLFFGLLNTLFYCMKPMIQPLFQV